ncbi:MAG: twin-arginine translocation signal domain-containing protein [Anaerolineae bacterium]|nr:twin-arginine translocation signal domain-containing protein [Anaerolineae bacterium]
MTISRRDFLKIAGVTSASTSLAALGFPNIIAAMPQQGRMLGGFPARVAPYDHAELAANLLPDSVHEILDIQRGFVRLPSGYVPEKAIQPMLEAHFLLPENLPAPVEVIAPYAAVRKYGAADAPLVARPGHGAVLEALKALPDQHGLFDWYQVDLGKGLSGWVQANQIQQVIETKTSSAAHAVIKNHEMAVWRGERELARFALACPVNLPAGTHQIIRRHSCLHTSVFKGIPWVLETNRGLQLGGVYWHNQFACTSQSSQIELSVLAAKTVFGLLPEGSYLEVM